MARPRPFMAALAMALALGGGACADQARTDSITHANLGVRALATKSLDTAVTELKEAVRLYKENHAAWFHLGEAYRQKKVWPDAVAAYSQAVQLKPSDVMYQLRLGAAMYEEAVEKAREDEAAREQKKPEEVVPDLHNVNFDQPLQHLEAAIKGNAGLYNAHYYMGKIYLNQGKPQQAAEAFTKAITAYPRFQAPYIALVNLYRQWDYTEQAIQVAAQGIEYVKGNEDLSELYEAQGMAYFDKGDDSKAIEAFGKAIELDKDAFRSVFQRGMAYFRKGELKSADKDFDAYLKVAGPSQATFKAIAQKKRFEIMAKLAPPPTAPPPSAPGGKAKRG
ncbi:MAG TPA: tetratricopeptide repeat protein [Kofleriaceae bacterium]|nr:tetratricopeptide repeat protein [Kofleriaceae bacterium]